MSVDRAAIDRVERSAGLRHGESQGHLKRPPEDRLENSAPVALEDAALLAVDGDFAVGMKLRPALRAMPDFGNHGSRSREGLELFVRRAGTVPYNIATGTQAVGVDGRLCGVIAMKIPNFVPEQWVSVTTAASLAGVHREWMRRLAKSGRVRSFEIEGLWFVLRRDAEKYVRSARGRPRAEPSK